MRLDVASILGLLAYFINYKFENISSSPYVYFLFKMTCCFTHNSAFSAAVMKGNYILPYFVFDPRKVRLKEKMFTVGISVLLT